MRSLQGSELPESSLSSKDRDQNRLTTLCVQIVCSTHIDQLLINQPRQHWHVA